jgi:hypothetical protein
MKKILLFCLLATFIYSCGSSSEKSASDEAAIPADLAIKSGYIKYKCTLNSSDFQVVKYFKDNGNLFHIETTIEAMGQTMLNHELYKDNYYYTYVDGVNEGTKEKLSSEAFVKEKDMGNEAAIIKAGGKKIGTEKVLDKECIVYEIVEYGVTTKKWIWGNLLLKSEANESKMEALEIKETSDFKNGLFELPSSIKFAESTES